MVNISVLTVTSGRKAALSRHLESIVKTDLFTTVECLFLLNGACDQTEQILKQYSSTYENIRYIKVENRKNRGAARNLLIDQAVGEILYFLDDDVVVCKNTFTILLQSMERWKKVDIMGGGNLTIPGSTMFQTAQGIVMGNFLATLWMSNRYKSSGKARLVDERSLILCNLAFRKKIFNESKIFFNNTIECAEENLLLQELMDVGYRALYIPELIVYHERRQSYLGFCKQIYTYGTGRAQAIFLSSPKISHCIFFVPSLCVMYLIAVIFFSSSMIVIPLYIYLSMIFVVSLSLTFIHGWNMLVFYLLLFPAVHIAYGIGVFIQSIKKLIDKCISIISWERKHA